MPAETLHEPWMVAVWPGMGNVALLAGSYLVSQLGARLSGELPARDMFDIQHVDVTDGVAHIGQLPRNMFFVHRHPQGKHDLVVYIGEAQPPSRGYAFCQRLMEAAVARFGVKRVFTFAAMSTQLQPGTEPRVFGVVSDAALINELSPLDVDVLKEGQISGMNGLLIAAAAERSIEAICLMGEMPFFATAVPNPRGAQAALEVFCSLADYKLDFAELSEQGKLIDQQLEQALERMGQRPPTEEDEPDLTESLTTDPSMAPAPTPPKPAEPELDLGTRQRIESMFEHARRDRGKAMDLKNELDRLGVFKRYENRFLDLFRKGE